MTPAALPKPLRTQLDNTVKAARDVAEMAAEKDAKSFLMPMSCRRQMFGLSDDMATKLDIELHQDALLKAQVD